MKTSTYAIAALCMWSIPAVANDRTEEGTAASRNVESGYALPNQADPINSGEPGVTYVVPAGSDPNEVLYRRYSTGSADINDFKVIKREGVELDGNPD